MADYKSAIKVVKAPVETVYERLSDFSRLGSLMPPAMVKDWEATADECHFTVDKIGRVGFRIADKEPSKLIKYALEAAMPLGIDLFIQLKESPDGPYESRMRLTLKADIPLLLRPLVGSKLQDLVDKMADSMSKGTF